MTSLSSSRTLAAYIYHFRSLIPAQFSLGEHSCYIPFPVPRPIHLFREVTQRGYRNIMGRADLKKCIHYGQTLLLVSPHYLVICDLLLPCDLLNYMSMMYCHSCLSWPASRALWGLRSALFVWTDQPSQIQIKLSI